MQIVHLQLWKFECPHQMKQMDAQIFGNLLWYSNLKTTIRRCNSMQAIYALEGQGSTISLDSAELVLRVRFLFHFCCVEVISASVGNLAVYGRFELAAFTSKNKEQSGRLFLLSHSNVEADSSCKARIFKKKG